MKETKRSSLPISSQKPCSDTFVTSTPVDTPFHEPVVLRQVDARVEPELGFAGRVLDMHRGPRLLREKK